MGKLDDEEFLEYCATRTASPGCRLTTKQIARLCALAGDRSASLVWSRISPIVINCRQDFITNLVRDARERMRKIYPGDESPPAAECAGQPVTDKLTLAVLGKLGEDTGKLSSAICRCIIQGVDEVNPVTKKPNRVWLQEEVANVLALLRTAMEILDLDESWIEEWVVQKTAYNAPWFTSLGWYHMEED